MTTRQETKDILLNEFADPMTLGLIAAGVGGLAALYTGHKRGQDPTLPYKGARWRIGQGLKKVGSYATSAATSVALSSTLKDAEEWHKRIAEKYGPGVRYQDYQNALAEHEQTRQNFPNRNDLIKKHDDANRTIIALTQGNDARKQRITDISKANPSMSPADVLKQKFNPHDPSPTAETIEQHIHRHDPKNIDIHGNVITPGSGTQSLKDVYQERTKDYIHPTLGNAVTGPGGKNYKIQDVIAMTSLEQMDAQNPLAAQYREKVTRQIIEPKTKHIQTLTNQQQLAAQSMAAHRQTMDADKQAQRDEMDISRAALPPVFDPTVSRWERVKRAAKKTLRNPALDRIRSSIG